MKPYPSHRASFQELPRFNAQEPNVAQPARKQLPIALILALVLAIGSQAIALTNNLALTPPMGWNDWNSYHCGISESAVVATANIVATNGMKAAGYQFIDIDDGWASSRDSNGVIQAYSISTKFPDGIQWLANYVHSQGLKLGIYTDHGTNTCSSCISGATPPKQPGSYGYEYVDAFTYGSWGVDYLKEDNCNVPVSAIAQVDYGRMSDGLMQSGQPITFCLCGGATASKGYWSWSPVLGNYWRTTGDISDTYSSMVSHLDPNSTTAYAAGPGRWNDPDMLEVGNGGMTDVEDQTHFTMWCIMAAPLIMGNNLNTMSPQALATLTNPEAIAVDQDPAGEQGVKVANYITASSTNEVWSKTLGSDYSTKAVVLFNRLGVATNITCYWTNLGLRAGTATVRDLWAHADLGNFNNSFTTNVPSHAAVLLKVIGTPPQLPGVGTTYLSDLQPAYAYTGWGTIVKDKSIGGSTLTLNGTTYSKGIGVNSRAGLNYFLGGVCSRFQATIGVDDEVGAKGSVSFEVFADGVKIYDSGVLLGGGPAQNIDLDVTGVSRLILGVGDGDDGNSYDHGDWANARVVVTNTTPHVPYAPSNLSAQPGSSLSLSWGSTLAALGYNVKRATQSGGPYTTLGSTSATILTDSNVVPGNTYYYTVSATNLFGEGLNATEVAVTACSPPPPPAAVQTTVTGFQVNVSWSAVPGASSYIVQRFTGTTPPTSLASVVGTNYVDAGISPGTTNYYFVLAVNACGQSSLPQFVAGMVLPVTVGPFTWNGGSTLDSDWSDTNNWDGGATVVPGTDLYFGGNSRLKNTNDTPALSAYSSLNFVVGAGSFSLNGNPITLSGPAINNSSNPQAVNLGLDFSNNISLSGSSAPLIIGGGVTNLTGAPGYLTLTLAGSGLLSNVIKSANSPGGTNVVLLNSATANWTLLDNVSSAPMSAPWVISVNNGSLTYGTPSSAPVLTTTTVNNTPQDNQVGTVSGAMGTLTISNGALTTGARLNTATALNCTGVVSVVGGTLNVGSQFQGANGANAGEQSFLNVSGGTMNIGSAASPNSPLYVASRGNGTVTITGGALNCGTLDISRNANGNSIGSVGTFNLNGGTVSVSRVGTATANAQTNQNGVSATFNFNGGVLKASASSATFLLGSIVPPVIPIAAIVKAGGAIIDDGGNAISILEPLRHDPALGTQRDGGLTKLNAGTLTLTAAATYTGPTTATGGTLALTGAGSLGSSSAINLAPGSTLDASALAGQNLVLPAGQSLTGFGNVSGNVIESLGATVSPGTMTTLGTLFANGSVTLAGTTQMKINKASASHDSLTVAGNLSYGGTLILTNLGGAFANGDSFQLFTSAGYQGSFSNIVPAIPALNLAWNTNNLGSGILGVVALPTPRPTLRVSSAANGSLVLLSSNGVPNWRCYTLTSTNLSLPLSNWTMISTQSFDASGRLTATNSMNAATAQSFYLLELAPSP